MAGCAPVVYVPRRIQLRTGIFMVSAQPGPQVGRCSTRVMLVTRLLTDADDPDTAVLGFVLPVQRDNDAG
jgi:hypothetical protein